MSTATAENLELIPFKDLRRRCRNGDKAADNEFARRLLAIEIWGRRSSKAGLIIAILLDKVRKGLTNIDEVGAYLWKLDCERIDGLRRRKTLKERAFRQLPEWDDGRSVLDRIIGAGEPSPGSKAANAETLELIRLYIARDLKPELRDVLGLHFGGANLKEISEKLGVAVSTVRDRLEKALWHIKMKLAELNGSALKDAKNE